MRAGRPAKYPWRKVKVGEEFVLDTKMMSSARNMACNKGIDLGKTFQVRRTSRGIICKRIR